ncbi:homeobox protein 13 isoform X2 [Musca domestica]|uniref:Homeobox protein 13 isoform X2 n=1 Tax=Musca domestica TaxID=7370 RepID=A0ABM3VMH8_MUSDO|nr:homeobox protein 13 isoform X2 [Musca domestica]
MWNFQRIICIWICCVSCMFGSTQLSSLVQAVPYEYFDDHDQSFYDLDTEQIQAKYDTRLLSQQMLKTSDAEEHQSLESKKGSSPFSAVDGSTANEERMGGGGAGGASFVFAGKQHTESSLTDSDILTKLKTNDASQNGNNNNNNSNNNKDTTRIDETTPAITEKQEIHLPRAASCYTNGQKYTHGQKVPRLDSCEVCLCMDGEIFCWWEKCDKKAQTSQTPRYDDYSTPYGESSTVRIQPNEKSTIRTTLRPMKKPKINKTYKFGQNDGEEDDDDDDEDSVAADYVGDNEYDDSTYRYGKSPYKNHHSKQQMAKKKHREEKEEQKRKEALELKEKQMKMKKEKLKKQQQTQQQQQQQQQHKTNNNNNNDHHYHHPEHHTSGAGSSKILNFPENLPSVLYYDYKTEEHQHHQHQHREQHLKHQHEKELKHRQHSANSHHHEYGSSSSSSGGGGGVGGSGGQDFNMDTSVTMPAVATSQQLVESSSSSAYGRNNVRGDDNDGVLHRQQHQQPPSSAKFLGNGNDNIYNGDLQTDSDILPEPPTKKPKLSSIDTANEEASAAETPHSTTLPYRLSTLSATSAGSTNITTRPLKKQMFSPWDYGRPNGDKVNKGINQRQHQEQNKDFVSAASDNGIDVADVDQDDAFHRWLTSTEKNKKPNGAQLGEMGGAFDDDFEEDDKNYENIDIDIDAASMPLQAGGSSTTKTLTFPPNAAAGGEGLENNGNLNYDINFNNNNGPNAFSSAGSVDNSNGNNNNNKENENDNISPFSNPYRNYKDNNNNGPSFLHGTGIKSQQDNSNSNNSNNNDGRLSSNEEQGIGGVVNIDIMLTATADISSQQQQHQQFPTSDHDKQNQTVQMDSKQKSHLISNTNGKDNELLSSLVSQTRAAAATTTVTRNDSFVEGNMPTSLEQQQILGGGDGNLLISNSNNSSTSIVGNSNTNTNGAATITTTTTTDINSNNTTSQNQGNSFSASSKLSQSLVSNSTSSAAESASAAAASASLPPSTPPPTTSTTLSPERQCNVMGKFN